MRAAAGLLALVLAGCSPPKEHVPQDMSSGPALVVLGTAQDGGLPHAGCSCERCTRARDEPGRARRVASVAVVAGEQAWLFDATPDLPDQLEALARATGRPRGGVDRSPVAGVFLTHAHMGHYLGLAWFGFEAIHARALPVHASPRMAAFLRDNAPWDQLVRLGNIRLHELGERAAVELAGGVRVSALVVPHRDEYADTLAFEIAGSRARVLYVPDSAPWEQWPRPLPEVLAERAIDVALLDGCFHSPDELPGRDLATLAHPLIVDSMDLLQPLVDAGKVRVIFTHLNHSNPAVDPDGAVAAAIRGRGFEVAVDGQSLAL
jgi:pyrroloquinoline quinone biosynthesis protein B